MKKILGILIVATVFVGGLFIFRSTSTNPKVGGYFFNAPTMASSSVGIYAPSLVLAGSSARQFALFCNTTTTVASYMTLQIGATSTDPFGIVIPGNSCYEMSVEKGNLFTSAIYSQGRTATTTMTIIYQNTSN